MKRIIGYSLLGAVVLACAGCRTWNTPMTVPLITWRSSISVQNNFALDGSCTSSNTVGAANGVNGGADIKLGIDTNTVKAAATALK